MPTYVVYPRDSIKCRAIARLLSATVADPHEEADYLIFEQGEGELLRDLWHLDYFRTRASSRGRRIILLPSRRWRLESRGAVVGTENNPPWVLVLDDSDPALALTKFREGESRSAIARDHSRESERPIDPFEAKRAFLGELGAVDSAELLRMFALVQQRFFDGIEPSTFEGLLTSDSAGDFYYLLALLADGYTERLHELNKADVDLIAELSSGGQRAAAKRLASAAESLRQTMASLPLRVHHDALRILIIDDDLGSDGKPTYWQLLRQIVIAFLPARSEVLTWNPTTDTQTGTLAMLSRYRSLDGGAIQSAALLIHRLDAATDAVSRSDMTLAEIARGSDFILVDQLYLFGSRGSIDQRASRGRVLGPSLVRGLTRVLEDLGERVGESGTSLPPMLALSRDDDPTRIQDAIRSGARDYVVKSQLLGLPAVLSRVQRSPSEGLVSQHRTFPELYRLSNEVQGLLRTVKIPGKVPLHRSDNETASTESAQPTEEAVAGLLRRIPKTDLHVHVGSCMSTAFLVVASAVGLARALLRIAPKGSGHAGTARSTFFEDVRGVAAAFRQLRSKNVGDWHWKPSDLIPGPAPSTKRQIEGGADWIRGLRNAAVLELRDRLAILSPDKDRDATSPQYQHFRAFLHSELAIPDRAECSEANDYVGKVSELDMAFFAIRFTQDWSGSGRGGPRVWRKDDLIRIYLLTLAAGDNYGAQLELRGNDRDLLHLFREGDDDLDLEPWQPLADTFFPAAGAQDRSGHSVQAYRDRGWQWPAEHNEPLTLRMATVPTISEPWKPSRLCFESAPIEYSIATGVRSSSLLEYLQGCEFSGAEHLRHPYLIHRYARQALKGFIDEGILYAELRASPDGYVDQEIGFEFTDVCATLQGAFSQAQSVEPPDDRGLPCKVSLIYVGKRHKSTREMILEAAAAAVMRPTGEHPVGTASLFAEREFRRCRVVGFDLAGKEVGNPPERFVDEFARLSRLHIPLTVHAGENESARFVEDSVLRLRARRIGHGLSLVEDPGLIARVREDRVGIELCPISNYQTSHFGDSTSLRPYPLRRFLDAGIMVSINTDNPIVSNTNIVKEFFQASYAWGDGGMPLWEALRLIRMGYVMSFLSQPERRAMLELVGQFLFDLFSDETNVQRLRALANNDVAGM